MTVKLGSGDDASSNTTASPSSAAQPVKTIGNPSEVVIALSSGLNANAETYKGLQASGNKLASSFKNASDVLDEIGDELDAVDANASVALDEDNLLSSRDRSFLQLDTASRLQKIDTLAGSAKYNGADALDGSLSVDVNLTVNSSGGNTVAVDSAASSDLLDGNSIDLSSSANAATSAGYIEDALAIYNQINGTVKGTISTGTSTADELGELAGASSGTADRLTNYVNPVDTANEEIGDNRQTVSNYVSAIAEVASSDAVSSAIASTSMQPIPSSSDKTDTSTDTTTSTDSSASTAQSYTQAAQTTAPATQPQKAVVDITA